MKELFNFMKKKKEITNPEIENCSVEEKVESVNTVEEKDIKQESPATVLKNEEEAGENFKENFTKFLHK